MGFRHPRASPGREIIRDNAVGACEAILAVSRGELPKHVVNRAVLDRPGFRAKLARYRVS